MRLKDLIEKKGFVKIVEFMPLGINQEEREREVVSLRTEYRSFLSQAEIVRNVTDALQLADIKNPKTYWTNPVVTAIWLKKTIKAEVIPTLPLRDYNRHGFISLVLSAFLLGLENLFIVRGDPYKDDELKYSNNVYDYMEVSEAAKTVSNLMRITGTEASLLGPIDVAKVASEKYLAMIKEREKAGIEIFITQPFFGDIDTLLESIDLIRSYGIRAPILHNVFPLKNFEDVVKCEVRFGWKVPKEAKEMLRNGGPEAAFNIVRYWYLSLWENRANVEGVCLSTRGSVEWVLKALM